jgi:hypothetical protein
MKQVTAVQWLIHKLITENEVTLKGENYKLFELAKEMEREQIIDTFQDSRILSVTNNCSSGKQYYNETYKSE